MEQQSGPTTRSEGAGLYGLYAFVSQDIRGIRGLFYNNTSHGIYGYQCQLGDMSIAADNNGGSNGSGFTTNSNPASMTCSGTCAAWGNSEDVDSNDAVGGVSTGSALASSDAMINAQRNADGSLPDINSL